MASVTHQPGTIYYEIKGKGEPLVLIKGLSFSAKHWFGYDDQLASHFKVISNDNRGISRSKSKVSWGLTVSDMAKDIIRILDQEGIDKAHILGLSLGGMIAMAFAAEHPDRCKTLTVMNSSVGGRRKVRISPKVVLSALKNRGANKRLPQALSQYLIKREAPKELLDEVVKKWEGIIAEDGLHRLTTFKQLLAALRFNSKDKLSSISVPTLVLFGNEDRFVPTVNSFELYRHIPKARLMKIPEAGHEVFLEQPELLTRTLINWISEGHKSWDVAAV